MHIGSKFKGYGYSVLIIVIAAFLVLRPIVERIWSAPEELLRRPVNALVLMLSGLVTLWIASIVDKRNGIDIFKKKAWISDIMESQHICFGIPMRLFGVLIFVVGFILL